MNQYEKELESVLAKAPKPEEFPTKAAWETADQNFRHRAGPSIRMLRSLASRERLKSQATVK